MRIRIVHGIRFGADPASLTRQDAGQKPRCGVVVGFGKRFDVLRGIQDVHAAGLESAERLLCVCVGEAVCGFGCAGGHGDVNASAFDNRNRAAVDAVAAHSAILRDVGGFEGLGADGEVTDAVLI